jgi:hypothetical protein
VFGGKFSPHYLAKVYYAYYPTAESPGPFAMANEFRNAYPESDIDWRTAMNTTEATQIGEVYSYRFNIPVTWDVTFERMEDIPLLETREDIMDWIAGDDDIAMALFAFRIPLEKYRWRAVVNGNTLTVKGKTTVLCVMEPVMEVGDPTEYLVADVANKDLYVKR